MKKWLPIPVLKRGMHALSLSRMRDLGILPRAEKTKHEMSSEQIFLTISSRFFGGSALR